MPRLLLLFPLLACGPSDQGIRNLVPVVSVTPTEIDFGQVIVQESREELVYVDNAGQAPLTADLSLSGPDAAQFTLTESSIEIGRDDLPYTVPIQFNPTSEAPATATLVVESNDRETPTVEVTLLGEGIPVPMPDICVDPTSIDWGDVPAGSSVLQIVQVENCGNADLELGSIDQQGAGAFRIELASDPSNAIVAPGETQAMLVFYEPTNELGDNGSVTIPTLNDPDEPEVEVTFIGNGGGNVQYPVAVIDCPGTASPPEEILLDGSGSYDPNALEPLVYFWTLLDKPTGSTATLDTPDQDTTTVFTDLGGDYEIMLQVENTDGVLSAPERCDLSSIPADDLHIELTWDVVDADLDLHLLMDDQAELFDVPGDCNWCNRNPSWGGAGTADDPRLDLDSRSLGPENINVETPADGTYPVVVHYYDPLGGAATNATVRVFAFGVEIFSDTQLIERNEVWEVGQVNWPDGTFGAYPLAISPAASRQCN